MKFLLIGDAFVDVWKEFEFVKENPEKEGTNVYNQVKQYICRGGVLNTKFSIEYIDNLYDGEDPLYIHCVHNDFVPHKQRYVFDKDNMVRIDDDESRIVEPDTSNLLPHYDAIIISDYNKGTINYKLVDKLRRDYRDTPIFVDTKPDNFHWYSGVTCITPNFKEVVKHGELSDGDNYIDYAKELSKVLNTNLAVTLGEDGCLLVNDDLVKKYEPTKTDCKNVCGAGDVFLGGLAYRYVTNGGDLESAVRFANKLAGFSVEFEYTGFQTSYSIGD